MATAEFESQLLSPPRRPYWGSAPQQPENTTRAEDQKNTPVRSPAQVHHRRMAAQLPESNPSG